MQTTVELYTQGVPADPQEMVDSDWQGVQELGKKHSPSCCTSAAQAIFASNRFITYGTVLGTVLM